MVLAAGNSLPYMVFARMYGSSHGPYGGPYKYDSSSVVRTADPALGFASFVLPWCLVVDPFSSFPFEEGVCLYGAP